MSEPKLADLAHQALIAPGVLLMGTTRRDGTARISGAEPLILDDELWLSMMSSSTKALDLRRDPRVLLHSIVTGPSSTPEIKLRGTVREQADQGVQQRYADAMTAQAGWRPIVGEFSLFTVDIVDVTYIGYDPETSGQHVVRWPEGREFLRPALSPTNLGAAEPIRRILGPSQP